MKNPNPIRVSDLLALPMSFITSTQAILAKKRRGKTYLAQVEAEELLTLGQQIVVLDPTGAWWGLRSLADGKSPGYPITIFGGDHGDVPLEATAGEALATAIVAERFSAVIDLSLLRKNERLRFAADFLETLYRLNKQALHLFMDEADVFCLDEATEILTRDGWRHHREIDVGTVAVAFDLANGEYKYEGVTAVIRKQHDGPMVGLKNKNIDILMTPEHRVVLRREQRAKGRRRLYDWTFVPALDVPHHIHVPIGGAPPGPGLAISDDMLRLIGWVATDGYFAGASRKSKAHGRYLGIEQSRATVKQGRSMVAELDGLLSRLGSKGRYERALRKGIKSRSASVAYYLGRELSGKVLAWTGPEIHRISRQLITGCSRAQLEVLMQGLLEGDGTFSKAVGEWVTLYAGLNEGIADDVQEIALRLGLSAAKRFVPSNGQWTVQLSRRDHHHFRKPTVATYSGIVWCVTLPSGAFVARRNGRVFVTGNCPQKTFTPEQARCLGAADELVRRGGIKGIGVTMISQRAQVVNKDVLSQIDMLMVLQMNHPKDLRAIEDWVVEHVNKDTAREMMVSLPSLPVGHAWVWAPEAKIFQRVAVRKKRTFDSGRTPKAGERLKPPKKLAKVDLERLGKTLSAAVEEAKANDPKSLRQRVVDLQKEIAAARMAKEKIVIKQVEVVKPADLRRLEALVKKIDKLILRITGADASLELHLNALRVDATKLKDVAVRVTAFHAKKGDLRGIIDDVLKIAENAPPQAIAVAIRAHATRVYEPKPATGKGSPSKVPTPSAKDKSSPPPPVGSTDLQPAHLRLLTAIAWWESIGVTTPDLGGVAFIAKTSTKSSAFDNNRSRLRAGGYIDYPSSGRVRLTETGRAIAPPPTLPPTNEALHEAILGKITPAHGRMLRVLIETYPGELSLEDFAKQAGTSLTSSAFDNNRSWLRARGLADYPRTGFVRATELLFPEGS